jgi:phosphoglycerate dehydrogenase-like enzyme
MQITIEPRAFLPQRILIGAGAHAELARALSLALAERGTTAEVRGNRHTELNAADLDWANAYVGFRRPPTGSMGNVNWVHCTGAGVDSWLYPDELPRDILLTRTSESFGPMIAEWALARALAFTQRLARLADSQRKREWASCDPSFVRGTRALVVGTGDVGTHIARAFAGLGCRVMGVSRSGRGDPSVFASTHPVSELPALAGDADWLILALPLTAATHGLVDRDVLAACRGAVLLNAGRGAVVDEAAIPLALENGWLSGAALDVFEAEPLPSSSPLWDHPRVMVSPHNSGPTTIEGAVAGFIECLTELERGEVPTWAVDRERQY